MSRTNRRRVWRASRRGTCLGFAISRRMCLRCSDRCKRQYLDTPCPIEEDLYFVVYDFIVISHDSGELTHGFDPDYSFQCEVLPTRISNVKVENNNFMQ